MTQTAQMTMNRDTSNFRPTLESSPVSNHESSVGQDNPMLNMKPNERLMRVQYLCVPSLFPSELPFKLNSKKNSTKSRGKTPPTISARYTSILLTRDSNYMDTRNRKV